MAPAKGTAAAGGFALGWEPRCLPCVPSREAAGVGSSWAAGSSGTAQGRHSWTSWCGVQSEPRAGLSGTDLFLAGWRTAANTGRRGSQVELGELLGPALSRELAGEVFRKKLFCPCERPGVSACGQSHRHVKAKRHQRLLLPFLRLWGEAFPLCSHLAPSVRVGSTPYVLGLLSPVLEGPTVLLAISPCNFQVDFLPDQIDSYVAPLRRKKNKHLLCARHCVRHFYIYPL